MTFDCTYREFCDMLLEFRKAMTNSNSTEEEITHAHKCLTLHYLGMNEDDKIETAAMLFESTTIEAYRRGWSLDGDVIGS